MESEIRSKIVNSLNNLGLKRFSSTEDLYKTIGERPNREARTRHSNEVYNPNLLTNESRRNDEDYTDFINRCVACYTKANQSKSTKVIGRFKDITNDVLGRGGFEKPIVQNFSKIA